MRFKEWLSDNLRYLILILIVALGIAAIVFGMNLYEKYNSGKTQNGVPSEDSVMIQS